MMTAHFFTHINSRGLAPPRSTAV